ncbi:MAG TPA: PIN domain-containing protein [Thermomicrobiales bacterium]|nr:PIN domain-containing protein [Thermomicrobiales bacterium]
MVDTSALVPVTLRREIQETAALGLFVPVWSPWIVAELNRVLVWRWLATPPDGLRPGDFSPAAWRRCRAQANRMMELLSPVFETVNPRPPYPPAWENFPDPGDHPIWAAAVASRARFVISENTRHFPPADDAGARRWEGIEYLRWTDFAARLFSTP